MELLFLSPHESALCTYHHELVYCVWLWYLEIQISPQEPPQQSFLGMGDACTPNSHTLQYNITSLQCIYTSCILLPAGMS